MFDRLSGQMIPLGGVPPLPIKAVALVRAETWRQHVAAEKQKLWLAAAQQRQTGFPPRAHGTRSSARGTRSSVGLSSLTEI